MVSRPRAAPSAQRRPGLRPSRWSDGVVPTSGRAPGVRPVTVSLDVRRREADTDRGGGGRHRVGDDDGRRARLGAVRRGLRTGGIAALLRTGVLDGVGSTASRTAGTLVPRCPASIRCRPSRSPEFPTQPGGLPRNGRGAADQGCRSRAGTWGLRVRPLPVRARATTPPAAPRKPRADPCAAPTLGHYRPPRHLELFPVSLGNPVPREGGLLPSTVSVTPTRPTGGDR